MATETKIVPDPTQVLCSMETLKKLAEENKILRMSAATGNLSIDEAIRFIKKYSKTISANSFPESHYTLLR